MSNQANNGAKPKLLILESDPDNGDFARAQYEALGYDVVVAPLVDRMREEYIAGGKVEHTLLAADINASSEGKFKAQLEQLSPYHYAAATAEDITAIMDEVAPAAVLTDYHLDCVELGGTAYSTGLDVLKAVRAANPDSAVALHAPCAGTAEFKANVAAAAKEANIAMVAPEQVDGALREQLLQQTPANIVTDINRKKPRLVIFDDDSALLARFTKQYTERGYDVTPVLVADGGNDDLMEAGRIIHGSYEPATDDTAERHVDPKRTVATELVLARQKVAANPNRDRFAEDLAIYEAMKDFTYGVKSKPEARALLEALKPDLVLSDLEMRKPADPDMSIEDQALDPDTIKGHHIMAMVAEILPSVPRVIHTGNFTVDKYSRERDTPQEIEASRVHKRKLCAAADEEAQAKGHRIFAKDEFDTHHTADAIDRYFRQALAERVAATPESQPCPAK